MKKKEAKKKNFTYTKYSRLVKWRKKMRDKHFIFS